MTFHFVSAILMPSKERKLKIMKYYFINKELGYLVKKEDLFTDAMENEYDDIIDPTSVEYGNYSLHYSLTNYTY